MPDPVAAVNGHRDTLPDAVVKVLQDVYPVGRWMTWRRTPKGSSNTSFFVTTETGDYVLRRSNERKTLASLECEARLIEYLISAGYPAPALVRPSRGSHVQVDGRYYLLTSLLPGSHYDPANSAHLLASARALARYHQLVAGLPLPHYRAPTSMVTELGVGGLGALEEFGRLASTMVDNEAMSRLAPSLAVLAGHAVRVRRALDQIVDDLPTVVVQGSFGRSALLFVGDELSGVIDYDRAGLELRALDLAYTVKALCRAPGNRWIGLDEGLVGDFLRAYEEIEEVRTAELDALPLVFQAQRLLKVIKKCQNVVAKHGIVAQEAKDVEKVAAIVDREQARVSWLDHHASQLGAVASR